MLWRARKFPFFHILAVDRVTVRVTLAYSSIIPTICFELSPVHIHCACELHFCIVLHLLFDIYTLYIHLDFPLKSYLFNGIKVINRIFVNFWLVPYLLFI